MKVQTILLPMLLALAPGCASHRQAIVFSDDGQIPATPAAAAPPVHYLEKADELRIEQLIFGYLLERHFGDVADYSAVFLQTDDRQVIAMMRQYPHHLPPIKESYRARIESHHAPVDRDTNKAAMILSADVNELNTDGTVDAIGRWYAGDAVTGFRVFTLNRAGNDWQITDVK